MAQDGSKVGGALTAVAVLIAAGVFYILWQVVQLALGIALGIVLAVLILAGGAYLAFRRASS